MFACLLVCASFLDAASAQNPPFNSEPNDRPERAQDGNDVANPGRVVNADFNQFVDAELDARAAAPQNRPRESIMLQRPSATSSEKTNPAPSLTTPFVALLVVVVLIIVAAKVLGRKESAFRGAFAAEAFDILSRRAIDARNSLVLVRVGDKLVVIGLSPNGMNSLSEITDRAEVERLTNLSKTNEPQRASRWFGWLSMSKSTNATAASPPQQQPSLPSNMGGKNRVTNSTTQVGRNFPSGLSVRELEEGGHV